MRFAFFARKYHKWLALIVGVQALIWCISGLYMTAVHIDFIHGNHLIKASQPAVLDKQQVSLLDKKQLIHSLPVDSVNSIQLVNINQQPVYLLRTKDKVYRVNATTLKLLPEISSAEIRQIADRIYDGNGKIIQVDLLPEYPSELGGRKLPIWKVQYNDWLSSTLYFIPETGELRRKRSDLWRWFDFLWMLHIMDYDTRDNVNNNLLRLFSSLGLLLSLTGGVLLFYRFTTQQYSSENKSVLMTMKKVHQWVALFLGLQLFLWMLSGLMFSVLSQKEVSGRYLLNKNVNVHWPGNSKDYLNILNDYPDATSIKSLLIAEQPAYQISTLKKDFVIDNKYFKPIDIDKVLIENLAEQYYSGSGRLINQQKEEQRTTENRKFKLPVWRVNFSDQQNSSLYFNAMTAQFYGIKTDTWRLFDIFWMLHIMDYPDRSDFNNALVIFSALITLLLALSGVGLILSVFRFADFKFLTHSGKVTVLLNNATFPRQKIQTKKNANLLKVLSDNEIALPSNCGGGGSCGLCKVKLTGKTQVSQSDAYWLSNTELNAGYRLACQVNLNTAFTVDLPSQVATQQKYICQVVETRFVTPLIKEIVLQVDNGENFEFKSGEYVLVEAPKGKTLLENIQIPVEYQPHWDKHNWHSYSSERSENVSRAYSMANSPVEKDRIVLNVRLALPDETQIQSGKVSSYLFALRCGDKVNVRGSFGDFHVQDNANELVFIGGGAGMAPLRSHILYQLQTLNNRKKISFWFGARNQSEVFYQSVFNQLQQEYSNFSWQVALSEPVIEDKWDGPTGMIHEVLLAQYLSTHENIHHCEFYICGPRLMNEACIALLKEQGIKAENIHVDDFLI